VQDLRLFKKKSFDVDLYKLRNCLPAAEIIVLLLCVRLSCWWSSVRSLLVAAKNSSQLLLSWKLKMV